MKVRSNVLLVAAVLVLAALVGLVVWLMPDPARSQPAKPSPGTGPATSAASPAATGPATAPSNLIRHEPGDAKLSVPEVSPLASYDELSRRLHRGWEPEEYQIANE